MFVKNSFSQIYTFTLSLGVSVLTLAPQGMAQSQDDFFAPPVIENVTEIDRTVSNEDIQPTLELDETVDLVVEDDVSIPVPAATSEAAATQVMEPETSSNMDSTAELSEAVDENMVEESDIPSPTPLQNNLVGEPVEAEMGDLPPLPEIPALGKGQDLAIDQNTQIAIPSLDGLTQDSEATSVSVNDFIPVPQQAVSPVSIPSPQAPLSGVQVGAVTPSESVDIEDRYYSADRGLTTSDLNAPTKADPIKEPGQKIVIIDRVSGKSDLDSRFVAAQRALDLGRYAASLEMFEQLYKDNPRDQRILMGRAVALHKSGFEEKAIQSYEDLLDLAPNHPKVLVNLLGLVAQQYPTVATERLKALYEKYPGNPSIAAQMGLTYAKQHNYESAIRYVGIALSLDPQNAQHYFNLAVIYDRQKDYSNAISYYERALEIDIINRGGTVKREAIYDRLSRLR